MLSMVLRTLLVAASLAFPAAAQAQDWPTHFIKATIPFGPGSAVDVVPRLVFEQLADELGQPIVVENRAGAGGTFGAALVAMAEPDGYEILVHSNSLTIGPALYPNRLFDATRDLASVLMIGSTANVMVVPSAKPWRTVQEFIAAAKASPGKISFGSIGVGSAAHLGSEKFRLAAGFEATNVPYPGSAEVITDLLRGRLDFYFCPLSTALPLIRDGSARALLVSTAERSPDLPDVPTPAEAGLKDAESGIWFGVFMPAGTPAAIIDKFHLAGTKVLNEPAIQAGLKKLGVYPMPMTPAQMDAFVKRETETNSKVIAAAGIHY